MAEGQHPHAVPARVTVDKEFAPAPLAQALHEPSVVGCQHYSVLVEERGRVAQPTAPRADPVARNRRRLQLVEARLAARKGQPGESVQQVMRVEACRHAAAGGDVRLVGGTQWRVIGGNEFERTTVRGRDATLCGRSRQRSARVGGSQQRQVGSDGRHPGPRRVEGDQAARLQRSDSPARSGTTVAAPRGSSVGTFDARRCSVSLPRLRGRP